MESDSEILNLVAKRKGQTFLGADCDPSSEYIVVTFNSTIVLIQPNDNKVIKSYSCTRGRKNTSAAIFVPNENEFVVVQNGKVLRSFNESDLDEAETFTLKHNIHSLIQCYQHSPLVMLEDGSLYHLHLVLEDPGRITPDSSIKIKIDDFIFVSSFIDRDENILVCSICSVDKKYRILASTIHHTEEKVSYLDMELQYEGHNLKAASAFYKSDKPIIATVWEDGSLRLVCVNILGNKEMNLQINKIASIEIDDNVSITSLSSDQVAVLCKDNCIKIIDLKFGTVLRRIEIENETLQMSTIQDYILLDGQSSLQKISFTSNPVTLASAILGQKNIREIQCAEWNDQPVQNSLLTESDIEMVKTMLKTKQETNFDKSWTKFWKGKTLDFQKQFCRSNDMKEILKRFGIESDKKTFWPKNTVRKIISNGFVSGRWCDGIFHQIFETEDWDMLQECLKTLNEIPENMMISCLTHIFKVAPSKTTKDGEDMESIPTQDDLHRCINEILTLSYTENILRKELSMMSFETVLKIVLYLTNMLEEISLVSKTPSLDQVICWLSMIIDAHLSEILLLEDSWPTIFKLQEAVKIQGTVFNELTAIDLLLTQIQCKLPSGKKSKKSLYTVEIMQF